MSAYADSASTLARLPDPARLIFFQRWSEKKGTDSKGKSAFAPEHPLESEDICFYDLAADVLFSPFSGSVPSGGEHKELPARGALSRAELDRGRKALIRALHELGYAEESAGEIAARVILALRELPAALRAERLLRLRSGGLSRLWAGMLLDRARAALERNEAFDVAAWMAAFNTPEYAQKQHGFDLTPLRPVESALPEPALALAPAEDAVLDVSPARAMGGHFALQAMIALGVPVQSSFADIFARAARLRRHTKNALMLWQEALEICFAPLQDRARGDFARMLGEYAQSVLGEVYLRCMAADAANAPGALEAQAGPDFSGSMIRNINACCKGRGGKLWADAHKAACLRAVNALAQETDLEEKRQNNPGAARAFKAFLRRMPHLPLSPISAKFADEEAALADASCALLCSVTHGLVLGYLVLCAEDMQKGKGLRDAARWEVWLEAALRGGGLGLLGDYFVSAEKRLSEDARPRAAMPAPDAQSDMVRAVLSDSPYLNMRYARAAFTYSFFLRIQEALHPQSLALVTRAIRELRKRAMSATLYK